MPKSYLSIFHRRFTVLAMAALICAATGHAQSVGNSGSVNGTVLDSTGAVVPQAKVELRNPVSGLDRSAVTDSSGRFEFTNVPFNPYHLSVTAEGFAAYARDVEPRSSVPVTVAVKLQVAGSVTSVTVEANGVKEPSGFRLSTQGITFRLSSDAMYLMRPKCHP